MAHAPHAHSHHVHPREPGDGPHACDQPCAHAAERADRAGAALAAVEAACRARGVRLTPIRREVLEALYATHRPLGAYDLAEELAGAGDTRRRLAPITVYRALDFLIEQGFVHRLASRNAFVACPHGHEARDLVTFLICDACGGVDEIASPAVSTALRDMIQTEGFDARAQVLEIAGRCAHCRAP